MIKVKAYSDIFVRYLLGDENNSDLLLSFINAVNEDYDLPTVKSVEIKNSYNLKKFAFAKESIIDVKATGEKEEIKETLLDDNKIFDKTHKRYKVFTKNNEMVELCEAYQK